MFLQEEDLWVGASGDVLVRRIVVCLRVGVFVDSIHTDRSELRADGLDRGHLVSLLLGRVLIDFVLAFQAELVVVIKVEGHDRPLVILPPLVARHVGSVVDECVVGF